MKPSEEFKDCRGQDPENCMPCKHYKECSDAEWMDPVGGVHPAHKEDYDPASMYE